MKYWRFFRGILIALILFITLSVVVCGFFMSSLLPTKQRFTAIHFITTLWLGFVHWLMRDVVKIEIELYGDALVASENAIVFSNHQTANDIPVLFWLCHEARMERAINFIAKRALLWAFPVGQALWLKGCVLIKRDWTKDEKTIALTFKRIIENDLPLWLIIYPEGTRKTLEKLKKAQEFAFKRDLYFPNHVLVPRTKGFAASLYGLKDHVEAVYDFTIAYPEGSSSLWTLILGRVQKVDIHVKRFPITHFHKGNEWIDETRIDRWLRQRFKTKDILLGEYFKKGAFPN